MNRVFVEHLAEPAMNQSPPFCLYRIFCVSNKFMANQVRRHFDLFQRKWEQIYGCPALLMQKICKFVCRIPWKRDKSKFLYQDGDKTTLADKRVVVRNFVCRNYDKVLMDMRKFSDNFRVTEHGLVSGVDRAFKSSNSTFQNISDRLNPLGKSVDFDILFLFPPSGLLLTRVHDCIKSLVS